MPRGYLQGAQLLLCLAGFDKKIKRHARLRIREETKKKLG
jgi:hypothetical protein